MAAPSHSSVMTEIVYAAISNIPFEFHSKDLRNYFSQFLEVGGFDCFHFKHRPERKITENERENEVNCSSNVTLTVTVTTGDVTNQDISTSFQHPTTGCDKKEEDVFPRQTMENTRTVQMRKGDVRQNQKEKFTTTCCVIRLHESSMNKLMNMYRKKNWVDSGGSMMRQLCHICRVRVIADDIDKKESEDPSESESFCRNQLEAATIGGSILRSVLLKLPELNPPDIMPNGNVGTPTSIFSQLITECRLPPKVISRLGIVFPKSRTNKRYGTVPLDYGREVCSVGQEQEEPVLTASGHTIFQTVVRSRTQVPNKRKSKAVKQKKKATKQKKEKIVSQPASEEGEDSGEEWDRHEALHNDVTNQERTTERLFESEMEVTWDKGSSGLVFYTDAAYWDKQEGDFDEKTTDDWDVDMSVYHDPCGGDKDARDFIQMRREQRMLHGLDCTSVFKTKTKTEKRRERAQEKQRRKADKEKAAQEQQERGLGYFEKHTKGFGRKLMKAQGWVEGEGLGKSSKGINEALHNEGQVSNDKRGFGYLGKKLTFKQSQKKRRQQQHSGERQVIISTIYDDPKVNDPDEPLLRSQGPYHLKYRDEVQFSKASENR